MPAAGLCFCESVLYSVQVPVHDQNRRNYVCVCLNVYVHNKCVYMYVQADKFLLFVSSKNYTESRLKCI